MITQFPPTFSRRISDKTQRPQSSILPSQLVGDSFIRFGGLKNRLSEEDVRFLNAAEKGELHLMNEALLDGADIEAQREDNKTTAAWNALVHDQRNVFRFLKMQRANLNATDEEGDTGLMWLVRVGRLDAIQHYVEQGVDVNFQNPRTGDTALMLAAMKNQVDILEYLLSKGADPTLENIIGDTALDVAKRYNFNLETQESVELLERFMKSRE